MSPAHLLYPKDAPLGPNNPRVRRAYSQQKGAAKQRGVPFEITLDEWWAVWESSGHWHERGIWVGQYVMCRKGDVGPYALGNVFIDLSTRNVSAGNAPEGRDLPIGVYRAKYGRFRAVRGVGGRPLHLGTFDTPEQAKAAYDAAYAPLLKTERERV